MNVKDTTSFIQKASILHKYKYSYINSIYIDKNTKLGIICPVHGEFSQTPANHLRGSGCRKCADAARKLKFAWTLPDFIVKANKIHNNIYEYLNSIYVNQYTPITITCSKHGNFIQLPLNHISGSGCPKCFGTIKRTLKEFIEKAKIIHEDFYIYSKSIYINKKVKLIIVCHLHGDFEQRPQDHLAGHGCPACPHRYNSSEMEQEWLKQFGNNIKYQYLIKIEKNKYFVDGFNIETNTIYEFYGDYWHGNPKIYDQFQINAVAQKTFGELYERTLKREALLKSHNYKIISMWEKDFKLERSALATKASEIL